MARCVLDTCRLCCPEEYPRIAVINVTDTDDWLRLLCRFQVQYDICFTPSPEAMSIMIGSEASWADVAQLLPSKVRYLVVSDSTLLWSNEGQGEPFSTYRGNAQFAIRSGARASELAEMLNAHSDKNNPHYCAVEPDRFGADGRW